MGNVLLKLQDNAAHISTVIENFMKTFESTGLVEGNMQVRSLLRKNIAEVKASKIPKNFIQNQH